MQRGAFSTSRATSDDFLDSRAGWTVAGAAFLSMFAVFSVHYSFGSFFTSMADEFETGRGTTALFFAITNFLYFGLGVLTGRVADRIGPRPVMLCGAASLFIGLLLTATVQSIWVGYLTYGLGVGLAVACGYVPIVAAVSTWFDKRRTTALGVAVAGIGAGTLAGAPLAEFLIDHYGWRQTYQIFAIGAGALLVVASFGADAAPKAPDAAPPIPVWTTIRAHRGFWVLWLASFIMVLPLFVPFVYLDDYMVDKMIDGSSGWLIGLIGVSSVVGRLALGALGARLSVTGLFKLSFLVLACSFLIWIVAGTSYGMLMAFTIVLGVSYGGFIALSPAVAAEIFGVIGLGGILGAIYTAAGVGGLIGPPLMGAIIDGFGYTTALMTSFVLGAISTAILFVALPKSPMPVAVAPTPAVAG